MGNTLSLMLERKNGMMGDVATMWHACQSKRSLLINTACQSKSAGKDVADLENLIQYGIEGTASKAIQIQSYVDESQIVKFQSDAILVL